MVKQIIFRNRYEHDPWLQVLRTHLSVISDCQLPRFLDEERNKVLGSNVTVNLKSRKMGGEVDFSEKYSMLSCCMRKSDSEDRRE